MKIRPIRDDEVGVIADIHVQSWQTAYRGIMPDALLAEQNVVGREGMWRETLAKKSGRLLIAIGQDDRVAGFIYLARARDVPDDRPYDGRVYALLIRPDRKRKGIGSQLLLAAFHQLSELGCRSTIVWTLEDLLASRRFYEHHGGKVVKSRLGDFGGAELVEVAYGWENLRDGT